MGIFWGVAKIFEVPNIPDIFGGEQFMLGPSLCI